MKQQTQTEFLTTTEVATKLRVSRQTIVNLYEAGELPGYRIGRQLRFAVVELADYLNRQQQSGRGR